jgi:transaldolase
VRLFLATDALEDVRWAGERGVLDGVVLPDDALGRAAPGSPARAEREAWLQQFARAVARPVFVAIDRSLDEAPADALAAAADHLGRLGDNVVVQMRWHAGTAAVIHQLASTGVRVAATFIGSAGQALLAAKAGAAFLFLDADRIEAAGGDVPAAVRACRTLLDQASSEADLVAVFPGGGARVVACALAGAHAAVVGTTTVQAMLAYPFAEPSAGAVAPRGADVAPDARP